MKLICIIDLIKKILLMSFVSDFVYIYFVSNNNLNLVLVKYGYGLIHI